MTITSTIAVVSVLSLGLAAGGAEAQPGIRTERVQFAAGASAADVKGQLKGDETVDYKVRAAAGQKITVALKGSNRQNYFNVNPPESEIAWHVGQDGGPFTGTLPADGDYTIRVYLMRAAARRNEASAFTLSVSVTGKPLPPLPASQDALVPGTSFHASTKVTCATMIDPKPQPCDAFVVRRGVDGTGTVEVRGRDGYRRRILFVAGKPVSDDAPDPLVATRRGDLTIVTFGTDERFEIPDALVTGG
jgi:hypothetical protein